MRIESHDLSRARKINKHFSRQRDLHISIEWVLVMSNRMGQHEMCSFGKEQSEQNTSNWENWKCE